MARHGTLPKFMYQEHYINLDKPTDLFKEVNQDVQVAGGPGEDNPTEYQPVDESGEEPDSTKAMRRIMKEPATKPEITLKEKLGARQSFC